MAINKELNSPGINEFMDFSEKDDMEGSINEPSNDYDPGINFMQKGLNMLSQITGQGNELKNDGIFGPKTMLQAQNMLKSLPPDMKKYVVHQLKKEFDRPDKNVSNPGVEGFKGTLKKDDTSIGEY